MSNGIVKVPFIIGTCNHVIATHLPTMQWDHVKTEQQMFLFSFFERLNEAEHWPTLGLGNWKMVVVGCSLLWTSEHIVTIVIMLSIENYHFSGNSKMNNAYKSFC